MHCSARSGRLLSDNAPVAAAVDPRRTTRRGSTRAIGRPGSAAWGLVPFAGYVALFLVLPTALAVGSGLVDGEGRFTLDNLSALAEPVILNTFFTTIWVSALTALVGSVLGALVCYALIGTRSDGVLRSVVDSISGVLAQFGGVMLAFAFIATIGAQGLVRVWLQQSFGIDIFAERLWIYEAPGLILPYIYFQVPLMIITFLPALEALKPQWVEANATLGGTAGTFWWRIGLPVLAPSFLGSLVLLFANAFSSYATAAALVSQGQVIVPLQIRAALTSETVLGHENLAGALALGMIVVMIVVMSLYAMLQRRASRWQR